jgi:hypothetical protein
MEKKYRKRINKIIECHIFNYIYDIFNQHRSKSFLLGWPPGTVFLRARSASVKEKYLRGGRLAFLFSSSPKIGKVSEWVGLGSIA